MVPDPNGPYQNGPTGTALDQNGPELLYFTNMIVYYDLAFLKAPYSSKIDILIS